MYRPMRAFCSSVDGEDESELVDASGLVVSAAGEDGGLGGESSFPPMLAPHADEANNTIEIILTDKMMTGKILF